MISDDNNEVSIAKRYVLLPIVYDDIWRFYKKHVASFWTLEEIDFTSDLVDWAKLTSDERYFISNVLAFFATSDGIVIQNLAERFLNDTHIPEIRSFYLVQAMMENIHAETYAAMIDVYIRDPMERERLINAIQTVPSVKSKSEWAIKYIQSSKSFAHRLLAFSAVEGILFSGCFCAIFWLKKRGLMPGLAFSNELISRDEGLHRDFACYLYNNIEWLKLGERCSYEDLVDILCTAVQLEIEFVTESLPVNLIGMNSALMSDYIKYVADHLFESLGHEAYYNVKNPFDFMDMISVQGKTNFFEKRVGDYQRSNVLQQYTGTYTFTLDEEF